MEKETKFLVNYRYSCWIRFIFSGRLSSKGSQSLLVSAPGISQGSVVLGLTFVLEIISGSSYYNPNLNHYPNPYGLNLIFLKYDQKFIGQFY